MSRHTPSERPRDTQGNALVTEDEWDKVERREEARKNRGRCHGCGEQGHNVRTCPVLWSKGEAQRALARAFGVNLHTISRVVYRVNWK